MPVVVPNSRNRRKGGRFKRSRMGSCRGSLAQNDTSDDLAAASEGANVKLEPTDADEYPAGLDCGSQDCCEGAQDNSLPSSPNHGHSCAPDGAAEELMKADASPRLSPLAARDHCLTVDISFHSCTSPPLSPSRRTAMSPKHSPAAGSKQFTSIRSNRTRSPIGGMQTRSSSQSPSRSPCSVRALRSSWTELCDASPPLDLPATRSSSRSRKSTESDTVFVNCESSEPRCRQTRHSRDNAMPRLRREVDLSPLRPASISPDRLPSLTPQTPKTEEMPVLVKEEPSSDSGPSFGCQTRLRRSSGAASSLSSSMSSAAGEDSSRANGSMRPTFLWVPGGSVPESSEQQTQKKSPTKRAHRHQYNAQLIEQQGSKVPKLTIRKCRNDDSDGTSSDNGSNSSSVYEVLESKYHRSPHKKKSKKRAREKNDRHKRSTFESNSFYDSPDQKQLMNGSHIPGSPPMKRLRLKFDGDAIDRYIPSPEKLHHSWLPHNKFANRVVPCIPVMEFSFVTHVNGRLTLFVLNPYKETQKYICIF